MARSLIETLVRSKLNDLKNSPERTTRNLVDLALHFSKGRFQKHFFEIAQEMLSNENSLYYQLVYHAISNIDSEHLIRFGINLGYNSCTYGANIIRKLEHQHQFNIPWCVTLELGEYTAQHTPEHYHSLLHEGKSLGIYTWFIWSHGYLDEFLPIIEMHTDCAFLIFCETSELTEPVLEQMSAQNHVMLVLEYQEDTAEYFQKLQERRLLYSAYITYDEHLVSDILNDEILCSMNETNAVFAFFLPSVTCSLQIQHLVQNYTMENRSSPSYKMLPIELSWEIKRIDSIISDDSCSVWFDSEGNLLSTDIQMTDPKALNHFTHKLFDIFKAAFPK